jgi:foldase protein PrsA
VKSRLTIIIAAVAVVIALAITGAVIYTNSTNYVATVAGEKITTTEYNFFLSVAKYQLSERQVLPLTKDGKSIDWNAKIGNDRAEDLVKNLALDNAREFKIELVQAKANNLKLSKEDEESINATIDSLKQQYGNRTEAEKEIKKQLNITLGEYKSILRNVQLTYKYKAAEQEKIKPTDEEISKFYETNKDKIDYVTVRHILIATKDQENKDLPADKLKEAEKKANDLLDKVKAGEDMKKLAVENSDDQPAVTQNQGEYSFSREQGAGYAKEFQEWAWAHNVGETGVVKTDFGFHVMKLEAKKVTLDDGKAAAKSGFVSEQYSKKLEDWKKDTKYNAVKNQKIFDSIVIK